MTNNYLSGKVGFVSIDGAGYSFSKWKFAMKTNLPKVTNFTSSGYQNLVAGITSGTITIQGPYNGGNMALTCGSSHTFTLGFTSTLSLVAVAFVESIEPDEDVDGNPVINVVAQTDGTFTAAIV